MAIAPGCDGAGPFIGGLAVMGAADAWGEIKVAIEPRFSFVRPFHQGLAYVGQGRTTGYINHQGQSVWRSEAP